MQTPLSRRKMLVKMGIAPAIPSVYQQRQWEFIDDRVPPEGEADGEFRNHLDWIHHAASYIGWTGAKCFDAKNRPCRNGGDFARARDEEAFPVRWYWPHRFPAGQPLPQRVYDILYHAAIADRDKKTLQPLELASSLGLKTARALPFEKVAEQGWIAANADGSWSITPEGFERAQRESRCRMRASCIRAQ